MPRRPFVGVVRPSITTSVRIDWELYQKAKRRGINVSDLANRALRHVLQVQDPAFGRVEKALEAEAESAAEAVGSEIAADEHAVQAALMEIQPLWNIYIGNPPEKSTEERLSWVRAKQERYPELRGFTPEALLKELAG